ncbi:APH(3') family aminoglycoside O-phosphotransferase [Deinococcus lacus]|uniref:APH(3') family aminoglycoside O-phosphotransferase n=1 Tax=Deinococcus lacus TaxID=392561 RepID=A0ABW1YC15_9DEIO
MSLQLPEALRHVLPVARWEPWQAGRDGAALWRSSRYVIKVQPLRPAPAGSLRDERERLRWFAGRLPVPALVGYAEEAGQEYLAMTRLPGIPLRHPDALLHPERVVDLLARALRELHALPVRDCPFNMSLPVVLRAAAERASAASPESQGALAQRQKLAEALRERPAREDLVVTHGDAVLDNFILDGEWLTGMVDVGRAGLADRHTDLALAYASLHARLGAQVAETFLDQYGRALIDAGKLDYYRRLGELA